MGDRIGAKSTVLRAYRSKTGRFLSRLRETGYGTRSIRSDPFSTLLVFEREDEEEVASALGGADVTG